MKFSKLKVEDNKKNQINNIEIRIVRNKNNNRFVKYPINIKNIKILIIKMMMENINNFRTIMMKNQNNQKVII